jgi:hypothetical protein
MIVRVHGFDWRIYTERIMPAFKQWIVERDETFVNQLYMQTQHAQEEQAVPRLLQRNHTWAQAQAFVKQLPQGQHSLREYGTICTPEHFTLFSDRYVYRHPPQLYQPATALRTIWSMLVEEYCLAWFQMTDTEEQKAQATLQDGALQPPSLFNHATNEHQVDEQVTILRTDLIDLLSLAGFDELANEISLPTAQEREERHDDSHAPGNISSHISPTSAEKIEEELDDEEAEENTGVVVGQHPAPLQLRGWLASTSVRAMSLFELLACGRRCMPFGYDANTLSKSFSGYLTPEEVWQLALCLRTAHPPQAQEAEVDYQRFRQQQKTKTAPFRLIDEVQPVYAHAFITLVRIAALQGLGLICSVDS